MRLRPEPLRHRNRQRFGIATGPGANHQKPSQEELPLLDVSFLLTVEVFLLTARLFLLMVGGTVRKSTITILQRKRKNKPNFNRKQNQDRQIHDSQRRDRILRLFLRLEIGQFSPYFGAISLLDCTENLEKKDKIRLEKFKKSSGETSPKLQICVPCGVERVLSKKTKPILRK